MRSCGKVIGSFFICFLCLVAQDSQGQTLDKKSPCDWSILAQKLEESISPQKADVPQRNECNERAPYDPSLAKATAAFINSGRVEPAKSASILELIKYAYKGQAWQTNYLNFAQTLREKLSSSDYKNKISETPENSANKADYDALDPLIALLKKPLPPPKACIKNIALLEELRNGAIPATFDFDKECPADYHSKLADTLLPLIRIDLHDRTSRTYHLIENIQSSLSESGQQSELNEFASHLQNGLRTEAALGTENTTSDADFLAHLLRRIFNPHYPIPPMPKKLAIGIIVFWLLTLTNTTIAAYLLYYNLKPRPSPLPPRDPQINCLAKSLNSLSILHTKAEGSISALERRLDGLEASPMAAVADLKERFGKIEIVHQQIQKQFSQSSLQPSEVNNKPPTPQALPGPDQAKLVRDVDVLNRHIDAIYKMIGKPPEGSRPAGSTINMEREILNESWKKFNKDKELTASIDRASRDGQWLEIRDSLLFKLPQAIPDELRATFDAILAPARDYHNLTSKIALVPRLVSGDLPKLESEAQELTRIREFTHLLAMTLNSNLVSDRLNFRLERWIKDQFLSFADLFLQRFQQEQLEGPSAPLEEGLQIVRRVLGVANLEPIELVLGQTVFDSTRHIGRSTTCDPRFPDGVIMAAVRNGFMQGGQQVLRQPEVIVNRVR